MAEVKRVVDENPATMQLDSLSRTLDGCAAPRAAVGLRPPSHPSLSYSATLDVVTVDFTGGRVPAERQLRVWLNFGEHGRELITSQTALHLLSLLALGPEAAVEAAGGDAETLHALRRTVFKVVPLENRGGRAAVEEGQLCLRKNGRGGGVDTNRNWGVHWGFKERDYDPYEEAGGAHAFSEPETVLLRDALAAFKPHAWVNVHSGMRALFMPFDHVAQEAPGAGGEGMRAILGALKERHCADCVVGSGGASVGYLAHGTATDYIYLNMSVPVAFTWEIYGDFEASNADCFRMFNPLSREGHDATVTAWAAACITLPGLLRLHPEVPQPRESEERAALAGGEGAAAAAAAGSLRLPRKAALGGGDLLAPARLPGSGAAAQPSSAWLAVVIVVVVLALLAVAAGGPSTTNVRALKKRLSDLPGLSRFAMSAAADAALSESWGKRRTKSGDRLPV